MIGPSGAAGEVAENQCRASSKRKAYDDLEIDSSKRKIFDELDIDSFCEEVRQTNRKRYLQELETPMELVTAPNEIIANAAGLFSPMSAQEAVEESPVARLEVLLVDGTNCTWTTMSELEQQQNLDILVTSSPSSSLSASSLASSGCIEHHSAESYAIEETANYQPAVSVNYWEPIAVPAVSLTDLNAQQHKGNTTNIDQQQQQQQQTQQFEDQENGNLSWLLDFKLDSFIEAADDKSTITGPTTKDNHHGNKSKSNGRSHGSNYAGDVRKGYGNHENSSTYRQDSNQAGSYPAGGVDNRNVSSARSNGPKKPPFTYTELIEHALQEKGELTVSAIYQWISEHFPYYKSNDDRWKNSVRHNLSINPHFRKGSKAPHGAGHLWAIANRSDCRPRPLYANDVTSTQQTSQNECEESRSNEHIISEIVDEVEAATASIAQPNSEESTNSILNSVTLEDSAEQILNGIKRQVEVQYLVPMMINNNDHETNQQNQQIMQHTELQCPFKDSDFLNPVSKEVVAEECGLISEGYLITDLNPSTLGLNVIEPEIIGSENLFGEELSFQFYELTPSQLQSA